MVWLKRYLQKLFTMLLCFGGTLIQNCANMYLNVMSCNTMLYDYGYNCDVSTMGNDSTVATYRSNRMQYAWQHEGHDVKGSVLKKTPEGMSGDVGVNLVAEEGQSLEEQGCSCRREHFHEKGLWKKDDENQYFLGSKLQKILERVENMQTQM